MRRRITSCLLAALLLFPLALIAKKKPPTKPVNINTAGALQLQEVPGIGPVTAEKILQMRRSYGPFKSVDDLMAIRGIGPKRLEKMRPFLTVGKAPNGKTQPASCTTCAKNTPQSESKSPINPKSAQKSATSPKATPQIQESSDDSEEP
jgi:competence ComEA-like helix-hairpin-helix protein